MSYSEATLLVSLGLAWVVASGGLGSRGFLWWRPASSICAVLGSVEDMDLLECVALLTR